VIYKTQLDRNLGKKQNMKQPNTHRRQSNKSNTKPETKVQKKMCKRCNHYNNKLETTETEPIYLLRHDNKSNRQHGNRDTNRQLVVASTTS
jgi:phage/plasmid primase-like uncharacterized protein